MLIGLRQLLLQLFSFVTIDKDVAHDGVQPTLEIGSVLKMIFVSERFVQGVLNQIFGVVRIFSKVEGKAFQVLRVDGDEMIEFNCAHVDFV
jgi:hypothetical protein